VDHGPAAPKSTTASVEIEIRGSYVKEQVRAKFDTPLPVAATDQQLAIPDGMAGFIPTAGVVVKNVVLEEPIVAGARANVLAVQVVPWLLHKERDPQDASRWTLSRTELPRYFTLRLRLVPRIRPPTTILIPLELQELRDDSARETVVCSRTPDLRNPGYDIVTAQVHQGVLDALLGTADHEGAAPLELPAAEIATLVGGIAGSAVQLTGVALGTDRDLKVGLRFDQGTPVVFDSNTGLSHFPAADWGVAIDPSFITASVIQKLKKVATDAPRPITLGPISVAYDSRPTASGRDNLISVDASATATTQLCHVGLSIRAEVSPRICRSPGGRSTLVGCTTQSITPHVDACIVFETFLFGDATMTVCTPGPCAAPIPPNPCSPMTEIQFDAGAGDTFYATAIETDRMFYIAGRSTFLDALLPARPTVPACP
jgi:hypothetical protein